MNNKMEEGEKKIGKETMIAIFNSSEIQEKEDISSFWKSFPFMFTSQSLKPESLNQKEIPLYNEPATYKAVEILEQPFALSGCGDITLREWFYLDEEKVVQGPFTTLEMDHWFSSNLLYDQLLIKFTESGKLMKLEDFCVKVSRMVSREREKEKRKFSFNL